MSPRQNHGRRRGAGVGRYAPFLRDALDSNGGWVVWDSHRRRYVRRFGFLGRRTFRGRRAFERADRYAENRNERGGR
jgi:hypothetical protein